MIVIDLMQQMASLADIPSWPGVHYGVFGSLHLDWSHLAAGTYFDPDVFAETRRFFDNFLKSGQVWALIIGFVVGYAVRGMSTYG